MIDQIPSIRVNGSVRTLDEVLRVARLQDGFAAIRSCVRREIIYQYAHHRGISFDPAQHQQAMNELRKELGLYSAAETMDWLSKKKLRLDDLRSWAEERLYVAEIKRTVIEPQAEPCFVRNRGQFDSAVISHIVTNLREEAQELRFRLEEGAEFYRLAESFSVDDLTKYAGGFVGRIRRSGLVPEEEAGIFGAESNQVVGPYPARVGYRIIRVHEVCMASFDTTTKRQLVDKLYEEWMQEQISRADIGIPLWDFAPDENEG